MDLRTIAALLDDRPAAALEHLLAVWRAHPTAALAAAIERYSLWATAVLTPLATRTMREHEVAWLELQAAGRIVDVDRLAAGLARGHGRQVRARLDLLLARPADPRWTGPVCGLFRTGLVVTGILAVARHSRDPRFERLLPLRLRGQVAFEAASEPEHMGVLDEAITRCVTADSPASTVLLEAPAKGPVDSLHEALLAAPDDIDAAFVWCDALLEAGDPWGEVVALQLKRETKGLTLKEEATERRLLRRYGLSRLGPAASIVDAKSLSFRRGLLDAAAVAVRFPAQQPLLAHRSLTTVRSAAGLPFLMVGRLTQLQTVGIGALTWDADHKPIWPKARFPALFGSLRALAGRGGPTGVTGLCTEITTPMGPEDLAVLWTPWVQRLRWLHVDDHVRAIVPGALFARLRNEGALEELVWAPDWLDDLVRIRMIDGAVRVDVVNPHRFTGGELAGLKEPGHVVLHGGGSIDLTHLLPSNFDVSRA